MQARPTMHSAIAPTNRRIGLLSTYPPKICGLATFAAALENELRRAGNRVDVVRIDDGHESAAGGRPVAAEMINGDASSIRDVAAVLSQCDVAIIQHEYGIYGGADGDEVIDLLKALEVPTIVVFHTVPLQPTTNQRSVLEAIGDLADRVVVMTESALTRLIASYSIDRTKVITIPHGASVPKHEHRGELHHRDPARPQLLTWGLLGPGKGIEHAIDALALLGESRPRPRYTIAGVTHPKVLARHGDEYRRSLIQRSWAAGTAASITFDDTYRDLAELTRFVASATVVILPYDSRDQVTSGVLVDAIAAGRPVIATAFPHAVELLASGAGIVIPHADPLAMAEAIRSVTSDAGLLASMAAEARRLAPSLSWSAVARQYARLSDELMEHSELVAT
ncbi:MAG TPA: glycosyltransferase [Acidimicrobiales bacterium]|nr:glycosyltransferase [Acidimicrobiales bacterium]